MGQANWFRLVAALFAALSVPAAHPAFDSAAKSPGDDLQVVRIVPEGDEVPAGRQITVTFDRPMVPVGDMSVDAAKSPVSIEPAVKCHWHWIDPRSLACEFDKKDALIPATVYEVTVRAGLKAADGSELKKEHRFSFATERPRITGYSFFTWRSPGTPVVQLVFNQPVSKASIEADLHFTGQKRVVVEPAPFDRSVYYVLALPGEKQSLVVPGGATNAVSEEPPSFMTDEHGQRVEARRNWLVSPPDELPGDSHYELHVSPGLRGYAGSLLGREDRPVVESDTFPDFRFLGIRCRAPVKVKLIAASAPQNEQERCDPLSNVALVFSAPVIPKELEENLVVTPDLAAGRTDYNPWNTVFPYTNLNAPHTRGQDYEVKLPEHLKAFQEYSLTGLNNLRDEFGRTQVGQDAMKFRTDHRPPRLRMGHTFAVLEQGVPSSLPLYVTNLTDLSFHYSLFTADGLKKELDAQQSVTRVWDVAYSIPAMVRDLLHGSSGVVKATVTPHPTPPLVDYGTYFDDGEPETDPATPGRKGEREFTAEVTPFQVHVKLGYYNTLVWVTRFFNGLPVAGARVSIYSGDVWAPDSKVLGEANTDSQGIALLAGRESLFAHSPDARGTGLSVRVQFGAEFAWMPLDWNFYIDEYRASRGRVASGAYAAGGHTHAWGTTAQGVYRLGDTVQFKFYLRDESNLTLVAPGLRDGYKLEVKDPTGKAVYEKTDIELSQFGAYAGEFRVPPTGAVGWYEFVLSRRQTPEADKAPTSANSHTQTKHRRGPVSGRGTWTPMQVLIADFTPAPFQVQTTLNGALFEPGDTMEIATHAALHAGGPYANAQTRVTARVRPTKIDVGAPVAAGFVFDSVPVQYCPPFAHQSWDWTTIHEAETKVSEMGELTTTFAVPDSGIINGQIEVESAVRDERGKYVAARAPAEYRGRDRYVGLRSSKWTFEEGKPASVQYLVVDKDGKVATGVQVSIAIHGLVTTAARVKGAGNAYLTSYEPLWEDRGSCEGVSTDNAQTCTFTPGPPGLYSIYAEITDTHGGHHSTELCTWVTGKGRVLWQEPDDMSLSLVPEKESYKVGEKARYLVRNPFPGAKALVTIERYGVIKSWVQTLAGNTPVIEFPIERDFLPGFYLSVLVMSPRVAPAPGASALNEEGIDLGRPTYRMGYAQVQVSDPYKALDVRIESDRKTYKPRDTVKLQLRANSPHEQLSEPIEFAVAVLDESVFDLIQAGTSYFDPYKGLYRLEGLDLANFGLISRLVGLQKFEKKGANAGGDGGAGFDIRSISKYVAYWNPSVKADREGRASLEFQLPDNLTGWRAFAVAVTPNDRLGLGDYKFASTKLTELRPVMPNQLTEGDEFAAGFSILNRAKNDRDVAVRITASGPIAGGKQVLEKTVHLGAFKRETLFLSLHAKDEGSIKLIATASDDADRDALAHTLPVHKRVSLDVGASYGTTVSDKVTEPILFPPNMIPGTGSLSVTLSPSVIGNIGGAFEYVQGYPYDCWEQKLTSALMAANYVRLRSYFPASAEWSNAQSLPQKVLDDAANYQAPNGGMGFWVPQDDRVSPYLSVATAIGFGELRKAGYHVPEEVENKLLEYLDRLLRVQAAPTFYSEGMVSSVRAVSLKALAQRQRLSLADLERYREFAPRMDLFGLAAYLQAAIEVKGGDELAGTIARRILSHSNESGGKFQFTETWDNGWLQLLATPMRSQCAILQAFLEYGETEAGAKLVGDVPFKLMRSITAARGDRDHWENTQENLYCANALAQYSRVYEKQKPTISARVTLDGQALGKADFVDLRNPAVTLTRPNVSVDVGKKGQLRIDHEGNGRLYYATRLSFAPIDLTAKETNAGMEIHREYSVERNGKWQLLNSPMHIKRGELVRVDLYLSLPAARNFVVVDDPVPGGLEPVNRELSTASTIDADKAAFRAAGGSLWFKYGDWSEYGVSLWSFYHHELKNDAARFFADYLSAGNYHLSYAAQAMASGTFAVSPVRTEEMYEPDVYGKGLPAQLIVEDE